MKKFFCSSILCFCLGIMFSACSHLSIDYEFNPGESFTNIQGAFSKKSLTAYKGYMYYSFFVSGAFVAEWKKFRHKNTKFTTKGLTRLNRKLEILNPNIK